MRTNVLIGIVLLLGSGCSAGFYLVGATPHNTGAPPAPKSSWKIASCATADGKVIAPPDLSYYVDDAALYEIQSDGKGARITNGWSDDKGRYFFTRVKTSHGWTYFFPSDASTPPIRLIYADGAYTVTEENGVIKPAGTPGATCILAPRP